MNIIIFSFFVNVVICKYLVCLEFANQTQIFRPDAGTPIATVPSQPRIGGGCRLASSKHASLLFLVNGRGLWRADSKKDVGVHWHSVISFAGGIIAFSGSGQKGFVLPGGNEIGSQSSVNMFYYVTEDGGLSWKSRQQRLDQPFLAEYAAFIDEDRVVVSPGPITQPSSQPFYLDCLDINHESCFDSVIVPISSGVYDAGWIVGLGRVGGRAPTVLVSVILMQSTTIANAFLWDSRSKSVRIEGNGNQTSFNKLMGPSWWSGDVGFTQGAPFLIGVSHDGGHSVSQFPFSLFEYVVSGAVTDDGVFYLVSGFEKPPTLIGRISNQKSEVVQRLGWDAALQFQFSSSFLL